VSIVANGLRKEYGALRAVDGVSFALEPRTIVGLIGPNGSGKTTILRMLATFLRPTGGAIVVAGHDASVDALGVRRSIGYLPEALPGYTDARVGEFLNYRAGLKGIERRARRAEIDRCLACCRLLPQRHRLLGRLSQGYRRRVGLADALLGNPPVLLFDEPTVGLDPLEVRETRGLFRELAREATILLSTHLLAEAQATCDRALMLVRGKLVSDARVAELGSDARFDITLRAPFLESAEAIRGLAGVLEVEPFDRGHDQVTLRVTGTGNDLRERIVHAAVTRGWGVREVRGVENDLEAHFVRMALGPRREAA
jgi:ABC-2 type transport system ATP-binding protein